MPTNKQQIFQVLAPDPAALGNDFYALNFVFNAMSGSFDVYVQDKPTSDHVSAASAVPAVGTPLTGSGGSGVTIGQVVNGGTADSILFIDGAGNLADDAGLLYDSATGIFTVGAPASAMIVVEPGVAAIQASTGLADEIGLFIDAAGARLAAPLLIASLGDALTDGNGTALVVNDTTQIITVVSPNSIAFPDNVRQIFNPGAAAAGLNVGAVAADPSTPVDGDVWYDSVAGLLRARINGASVSLGAFAIGGATTQVQFNNAGALGGVSGFTSDGTNVTAGSGNLRATRPRVTTSIDDANGNELIAFTAVGSAINEITISNNSVGLNPVISATGGDTNIGITYTPKGTGSHFFTGASTQNTPRVVLNTAGFGFGKLGSSIVYVIGSLDQLAIETNALRVLSTGVIGFSSTIDPTGAFDSAFNRVSAGVIGVINGTPTVYRDLRLRNLLDTNGVQVVTTQQTAVADAAGGATIDAEARTAINSLLARLRTHGLIAP